MQLQRLLKAIAKITGGHATVEATQRIADQCDAYLDSKPDSILHTPVGVSYLLLSTLLEARRKYSDLAAARDDVRDRLTIELEAMRLQYESLLQVQRNQKEATQINEATFGRLFDEINAQWRRRVPCSKVEEMQHECQTLREELDQLRQTNHDNASTVVEPNNDAISYVDVSFAL
ncbi:hypothetical protein OG21DRAFT_1484801 [Imleria badia]|nr:hypothetical protein OG21DRAFT_1484801 [Imleria badia]